MSESFEDAMPKVDRLPPHSLEAEQGMLGCCLLSPNDCVPQLIAILGEDDEVCYDLRHQTMYAHMVQMWSNRAQIDVITLQQRLKDFDLLESVGGIPYLNALQDSVPSAANLTYYTGIVRDKALLRRSIATCTELVGKAYDCQDSVDDLLDGIERDVLAIRRTTKGKTSTYGMKELVSGAIADIEAAFNRNGSIPGLATGFVDLDRMTGGLRNGDMVVIAARPSVGKTSLAMNIAEYAAVGNRIPVGIFSLEMTKESLTKRLIASLARVNLRNLEAGFGTESDAPRMVSAAGRLSAAPIWIDDTPALSVMQIRARARLMVQMYGVKLIVVDYLQLAQSTTRRAKENRQQEVSEISSGLKALAKELGVPVIVLSQLNREIERTKRKPNLSDLRESGAIEQDADIVAFLYKPVINEDDYDEGLDAIPVNLLIAKQRNGPTGEVNLTFLKGITRFESAAKVSQDDLPRD